MRPLVGRGWPLWSAALLVTTACSPGAKDAGDAGLDGDTTDLDDTGGSVDDGGSSTDPGSWWLLDATLVISEGELQADGSSLSFIRRSGAETTCQDVLSPVSVAAITPLPHESVYTWWQVDWDTSAVTCFVDGEGATRSPLLLGVGAMHPEIEAVLPSLLGTTDSEVALHLNGAYARLPEDDQLLVFGAVGLQSAWAGEGEPAVAAPLADGTWVLRSAYSLPLTW